MDESNLHAEAYRLEAEELLADIEETVLDLERDPEDMESVNRIFRAMHTIKGSGAMFGFDRIADFTHHVETAMDRVREGKLPVTKELIDLILASRDRIKGMLDAQCGEGEADEEAEASIIRSLGRLMPAETGEGGVKAPPAPAPAPAATRPGAGAPEETYRIRFTPNPGIFATGTDPALLLDELRDLGECTVVARMEDLPPLGTLSPESCRLSWDIVLTTTAARDAIEEVFIFVADEGHLRIEAVEGILGEDPEEPPPRVGEILQARGEVTPAAIKGALSHQKRLGELLVASGVVPPEKVAAALHEQRAAKRKRAEGNAANIRVPTEKLDGLVNLVGELVVTQASLSRAAASYDDTALAGPVEEVTRLTEELKGSALNIRMMPIGSTFGRFRRLLRDLSAELGKEIDLVTEGGETELDKTILERLNEPLVHLIRNSIDHGIETPEERAGAGKPARGTIRLSAAHRGADVVITIADDGAGLDAPSIRRKAVERGLIPEEREMADRELFAMIFSPGFSTSDTVTAVSGRGVGMDVVRRTIESLKGDVAVDSEPGAGTTLTIRLPLTLAIIDGLLVTIGKGHYILPLMAVEECVELGKEARSAGSRILNVRGDIIPFVRLRERFAIAEEPPELEHVVIADVGGRRTGFVVDSIVGSHQTVKKSLGPAFGDLRDVSGASILGDGTVALILDVGAIA